MSRCHTCHAVTLSRLRSEFESEESGCGVGLYQLEAATTLLHYLARDAKSDAAAGGFGGEERDEDLLGFVGGYDLILTFTQWWKVEAYGVHAIEQVFAECTFPHPILPVAVGG